MEEIRECLDELVHNQDIISIISKISSSYRTLSFYEKKKLFTKFNEIVSEIIGTSLQIYINKHSDSEFEYSDVTLSDYNEELCLNGVDKNPYIYLKDILFYHFVSINEYNYDLISIGDIIYDGDYTGKERYIASYNQDNIMIKELVKEALDELITNPDREYKKEYDLHIDNNLTLGLKAEFLKANEILDNIIKEDIYMPLVKIDDLIVSELSNKIIKDKDLLAMYSIDNILMESLRKDTRNLSNIEVNLNNFINEYFSEFSNCLKIEVKDGYIRIDGVACNYNNMFLDELFKRFEYLDKLYKIVDNSVSDELVNEYNSKLEKKLSKLEVYLYSKLEVLDSHLKNKNLELVNYPEFSKIFSFEDDEDIYIDNNRVFNEIFDDKEFIRCIDDFLYGKKGDSDLLYEIVDIMNSYYFDADFELVLNDNFDINNTMGTSEDKTIYINSKNCSSKIDLLETLFHEYRHLIQIRELEDDHQIYNDTLYKYIKMNYNDSPYKFNYSYAIRGEAGYQNDIIYDLQPVEFDAENFAKYMLKGITKNSSRLKSVGNGTFNEMYSKKFKFFSNKKRSLVYYENWYNIYKIDELVSKESKQYRQLIKSFKYLDEVELDKLFLKDNFDSIDWCYKKEFFKALLLNKGALIQKSENQIKINNKEFNLDEVEDHALLEQVLLNNALELAKQGKIKLIDVNKYVYRQALKFKLSISDLNRYNLYRVYGWHSTFLKYNKGNKKKLERVRSK